MARIGVDFGASGTVIGISLRDDGSDTHTLAPVSNLIHLTEQGDRITGQDVITSGLVQSDSTARHLRHYVINNSPVLIRAGRQAGSYQQEARNYIVSLIRAALKEQCTAYDAVFCAPADAPEQYIEWLASVSAEAGLPSYTIIDELFAAAIGYGISPDEGKTIMVIDFGADGFEVTIAILPGDVQEGFPSCRVIGKAASDIGGRVIDGWLADEVLRKNDLLSRCAEDARARLIIACKKAKEALTYDKEALIHVPGMNAGKDVMTLITWPRFEEILQMHDLTGTIKCTIDRAIAAAKNRGYDLNRIEHVLMIGGMSLMPAVRDTVLAIFEKDMVYSDDPRSAVAKGAAMYRPDHGFIRRVPCDYGLKWWDPLTCRHQYRYIVRKGTEYPTTRETARILISAAYDGQTYMGIALYAIGKNRPDNRSSGVELVADPDRGTRCIELPDDPSAFHAERINNANPTFLVANPPGRKGEVRFELEFSIDSTGQLRLSARDLTTGAYVLENHICAQLITSKKTET
ncbi:MAG: chaperone protein HscA [Methanoregula sp. PtaU1.Bin051]|nr:MAG: chaperone protein HscA [Methanoregula sp. PtaU1.Bin051]